MEKKTKNQGIWGFLSVPSDIPPLLNLWFPRLWSKVLRSGDKPPCMQMMRSWIRAHTSKNLHGEICWSTPKYPPGQWTDWMKGEKKGQGTWKQILRPLLDQSYTIIPTIFRLEKCLKPMLEIARRFGVMKIRLTIILIDDVGYLLGVAPSQ